MIYLSDNLEGISSARAMNEKLKLLIIFLFFLTRIRLRSNCHLLEVFHYIPLLSDQLFLL